MNNYLPLTGGTLTGDIVVRKGDGESEIQASNTTSGTVYLYANETSRGIYTVNPIAGGTGVLRILNDNTVQLSATSFFGGANGIDCSVDSQGAEWIRYSNGIQICWGVFNGISSDTYKDIPFPKPFLNNRSFSCSVAGQSHREFIYLAGWNNTKLLVGASATLPAELTFLWQAIGRWK